MTDVDLATLTREFPLSALKQRVVGGGKALSYVEGHTVIHRLNEATGNCWSFSILNIDSLDVAPEVRLVTATVALTIPGHGTRQHIGVQTVNARGGEDLVKGAVTDALKKAATLFGVGLELYGPDYEATAAAKPAPRATAAVTTNAPAAAVMTGASVAMRRLHAVGRDRSLDHDALHRMVAAIFATESLAALPDHALRDLADYLEGAPAADWLALDADLVGGVVQAGATLQLGYWSWVMRRARDHQALQEIGNDIGRLGLTDEGLRDEFRSAMGRLRGTGGTGRVPLIGMPEVVAAAGDDQYTT